MSKVSSGSLRLSGNAFQTDGLATENARQPRLCRVGVKLQFNTICTVCKTGCQCWFHRCGKRHAVVCSDLELVLGNLLNHIYCPSAFQCCRPILRFVCVNLHDCLLRAHPL